MITRKNLCVDCTTLGKWCRRGACPNNKPVPVHVCDKCGVVLDDVYEVNGVELCEKHLKEMFRKDC